MARGACKAHTHTHTCHLQLESMPISAPAAHLKRAVPTQGSQITPEAPGAGGRSRLPRERLVDVEARAAPDAGSAVPQAGTRWLCWRGSGRLGNSGALTRGAAGGCVDPGGMTGGVRQSPKPDLPTRPPGGSARAAQAVRVVAAGEAARQHHRPWRPSCGG